MSDLPKLTADEYCRILEQWAQLVVGSNPRLYDAVQLVRSTMLKSNYLARRLYGGDEHRTIRCPLHKGRWSGCSPEPCPHGCSWGMNITGWLPAGLVRPLDDAPWPEVALS